MERDLLGRFVKGHKGYKNFKKNPKYHKHNDLVWHPKSTKHHGSHRTKTYRRKISSSVSKLWKNGDYIAKHTGPNNPNWKGGAMNNYQTLSYRMRAKLRVWAKAVKTRDGCCVLCGSKRRLQADHIKPVARYPKLMLALTNGRTVCARCHVKTDTYGKKLS